MNLSSVIKKRRKKVETNRKKNLDIFQGRFAIIPLNNYHRKLK